MVDDRFVKGSLSGTIGALAQNIYAYLAKLIGFTDTTYLDVARAVLFGQNFTGLLAQLVGLLGQLVIDSFWGIIFAYVIQKTTSKYYLFKGLLLGAGIWFVIRVIGTKILDLPVLIKNPPQVALFFFIGASIFGLTVSLMLKVLDP